MGISHPHTMKLMENPAFAEKVSEFHWPDWSWTARIAGAYFAPGESDASLARRLHELVDQEVNVILADSPWGQEFEAWVDDARFASVKSTVSRMVETAHRLGLKVVLYQTGLELLCSPGNKPGSEYTGWAQLAMDGTPILFNDISNDQQHWIDEGVWDFWLSPFSNAFRALSFCRVLEMVSTGIDGVWIDQVYLQGSVGHRDDLWPSTDASSTALFTEQTGFTMPNKEDWDDPSFRQWVIWRHSQMAEFLQAEMNVARSMNPQLVFMNENSCVDTGRSTYVGTDPTCLLPLPDIATCHEIETIADRMDKGETGMKDASLDEWLAFRTMAAFAREADRGKPCWILTYGYEPRDSAQLAGMALMAGACFFETKGPQMAEPVSTAHRKRLFGWIREHEQELYDGELVAHVGLLYSPRNRDLVDTVSGEPYSVQDSIHFAAYRSAANTLYKGHIPFDVVIDTDLDVFSRYKVLVAPQLQLMSDATVDALLNFDGTMAVVGEIGIYDEWLNPRSSSPLLHRPLVHLSQPGNDLIAMAHTGLMETSANPEVQLGLRRRRNNYTLIIVNTDSVPTTDFTVEIEVGFASDTVQARLYRFGGHDSHVPVQVVGQGTKVLLVVPSGIDTLALIALQFENEPANYQSIN